MQIITTLVLALLALCARAGAQDYARLSPFEAVRWVDERPEVQVRGRWYALRAIDGHEVGPILAFCESAYGPKKVKRFEEDLVQVMTEMGSPPANEVALALVELDSGREVALERVAMTEANRRAIWMAAKARDELATTTRLDARTAHADLDQLEQALATRFAYRDALGFDWKSALLRVRKACEPEIERAELALAIAKLLARFGDGHTRVDGLEEFLPKGFLPCLVEDTRGLALAVKPDRSGFVDDAHPVLTGIDGEALDQWLKIAGSIEGSSAPHALRRRAMRNLRLLGWLRNERGAKPGATVRLELASLDGKKRRTLELPLAVSKPIYGQRLASSHRVLDDIGYLRLASMDDDEGFLDQLDAHMQRVRDSRGLVIDVRGNGGGSRAALLRLMPYFMAADEAPFVANVAAYRLAPGERADASEGYLADRWLFPATAARWDAAHRSALERFASSFKPEWRPPAGEFSAWHFLAPRRADNPRAFFYAPPIAILLDADCFSATDVFLAAFAGRPRTTLIGTTSGGGSGRALSLRLARSGLELRLSSMASFRADGRRIDGRGIEPDLVSEPAPENFVGRGDAVLDAALAHLREK